MKQSVFYNIVINFGINVQFNEKERFYKIGFAVKKDVIDNSKGHREIMKLVKISKTYKMKNKSINVLNSISVNFYSNKFYAIKGHSGSGKSTLINILGLIDKYDSGEYNLFGLKAINYNDLEVSKIRRENIGFIFQGIYLNPNLKAYENVIIPMLINKNISPKDRKKRAVSLLEKVGLANRTEHYPNELSGGEQQRVAIARALANDPSIILADEPTGNLDLKNEEVIFSILQELSKNGKCVIVVSHSDFVNKYADEVYEILNGNLAGV